MDDTWIRMRLWGIRLWWAKIKMKVLMEIVWWLPKRIIYFSVIRAAAYATTGKFSSTVVYDLKLMDVLK